MQTTTEIKLDIARNTSPPTVYAKQGDNGTRYVTATLLENGVPYTLDSGITARIRVLKPDNTAIYNAATVSGNTVTAELTSQALAVPGVAIAEIGLYKGAQILTTFIFYVRIERSAVSDNQIESSDEFGVLEETIQQALSTIDIANMAAETANIAAENANAAFDNANTAAEAANTAASSANTAAETANTAANIADTAAETANTAAKNADAATARANAAAAEAENAVNDIYHDKNFILSVNDDNSLSLTYNEEG